MGKQCGYLDTNENFHKTLLECNNSNLWIEMLRLRDDIDTLNMFYSKRFSRRLAETNFLSDKPSITHLTERIFLELLVQNKHLLFEYKEKIEELERRYKVLQSKKDLPKVLRKDWWLGLELTFEKD